MIFSENLCPLSPDHALERRSLPHGGGERAFVEIVELAADRDAMREPRDLDVRAGSWSVM